MEKGLSIRSVSLSITKCKGTDFMEAAFENDKVEGDVAAMEWRQFTRGCKGSKTREEKKGSKPKEESLFHTYNRFVGGEDGAGRN